MSPSFFELIDPRSFSSLWYWVTLTLMWSGATHWVLGVPYDMVPRARRQGGRAMQELETLVRIAVARRLSLGRAFGLWLVGLACFVLAGLFTAGFVYGVEVAQAAFLLLFPLAVIWLLSLNTAAIIEAGGLSEDALCRQISRHRLHVQILGAVFIFLTAMWGMFQNFAMGPLGM